MKAEIFGDWNGMPAQVSRLGLLVVVARKITTRFNSIIQIKAAPV